MSECAKKKITGHGFLDMPSIDESTRTKSLPNLACLDTRLLLMSVSRSWFDHQTGHRKTKKLHCQGHNMHKAST